jgi:tRNA (guanine-N7-)-methyltransferase
LILLSTMLYGCAEPGQIFPEWGSRPIEVEIGPGRGGFALDYARLHPEVELVLIETRRSDCELIRTRAVKRGLANLHVYQGDAKLLLPSMFLPGSLAAAHVQFPDPWWKTRHHKRRMVDSDLALLLRRLLQAGGLIDFRTDVPAYAREAVQTWREAGFLELPDEPPDALSTRERRYAVTGQPVFRARFRNPESEARPAQSERTGREWRDLRRK